MAKYIKQEKITKYAKRARALTIVKKIQEKERDEIVKALTKGFLIPVNGPYTLDLSPNGGKEPFDWRQAHEDLLTQLKSQAIGVAPKIARVLVQAEMKTIDTNQPAKKAVTVAGKEYIGGVKLVPKVNEKFRQENTLEKKAVA